MRNIVVRSVKYRYLYPTTSENSGRVAELLGNLRREVGSEPVTAEFVGIPEDEFYWCTEHVLFDPNTNRECAMIVDIWGAKNKSAKADIEMSRSKRAVFRTQFHRAFLRFQNK